MCEITDTTTLDGEIVLFCTPYDGDFQGSTVLKIFDESSEMYEISEFLLDQTRPCFGISGIEPIIKLQQPIPEKFLHPGNKVLLEH